MHDSFRQLIAQNRDGKIHALQISTESSIRSAQERSKNEVTGKLKAVAYDKINQQTDALISMIGENQVDYRFFIGFKLLLNDQEFSMKSLTVEAKNALSDFVYDVNHKLMGDFVSMSNDEILRFQKMEKLNVLDSEIKNLTTEKTNLVTNSTSGVLRANDIKDLIDYVSADNFNGDYTEELFEEFVENIIVNSRDELTFNLKCGLSLKEKVVR